MKPNSYYKNSYNWQTKFREEKYVFSDIFREESLNFHFWSRNNCVFIGWHL